MIRDASGNLYGSTAGGGNRSCTQGCGTLFKLDATGNETVLYTFTGGAGGIGRPYGRLMRDAVGNLYGTTASGGDLACPDDVNGCGMVFKLDPSGAFTILHVFAGGPTDGRFPNGGLLRDEAGNLYGTTAGGGNRSCTQGCGTLFKLDATGNETVLHTFSGADGARPKGGLIRDAAGNFYGTTAFGGNLECSEDFFGCGTIFKLNPSGVLTTQRVFGERGTDLRFPSADLIRDAAGNLYGTTPGGGTHQSGTLFKLDAAGRETVLYNFAGAAEGTDRKLGVLDSAFNLYGTAFAGGDLTCDPTNGGCGVVFKIKLP